MKDKAHTKRQRVEGPLRVLMAGGGTGGHVIPALAIARELRDAHGVEVAFVGTARGLETDLVPKAGFPLQLIHVGQLNGVSLETRIRTVADLPVGLGRCVGLLREFRPDVVVGVGGYASGPAMLSAIVLRVPTMAFEPNAVPGMANRLVGRFVKAAAVNFAQTLEYFPGAKQRAKVTGIPVRPDFFEIAPKREGTLRLLVFGGSQGARFLNETVPRIAGKLLEKFPDLEIVHQAGGRNRVRTLDGYERAGHVRVGEGFARVGVQPYLDAMVEEFAAADVVLCRSGASTMAELAAAGKASVLVPFPMASDDHQKRNAESFAVAGAAEMVIESPSAEERMLTLLSGLLENRERRLRMGDLARGFAHRDAGQVIAGMVLELAGAQS